MKKTITTQKAPAAIGPYSQGMQTENFAFTSGQLPIDMTTGNFPDGIEAQTKQSLENVKAVLEAAGSGMDKVIKTTVLLNDINDFDKMNEIYAAYFVGDCPARSCFEVACLPKHALVEIEATAVK